MSSVPSLIKTIFTTAVAIETSPRNSPKPDIPAILEALYRQPLKMVQKSAENQLKIGNL